jgi:hypothetical protein
LVRFYEKRNWKNERNNIKMAHQRCQVRVGLDSLGGRQVKNEKIGSKPRGSGAYTLNPRACSSG